MEMDIFRSISPIWTISPLLLLQRIAYLLGDTHQSVPVHAQLNGIDFIIISQIHFLLYDLLFYQIDDDVLGKGCRLGDQLKRI